jgi:acyl-CoA thioesterase
VRGLFTFLLEAIFKNNIIQMNQITPQQVLDRMLLNDKFSAWLGLQVDEIQQGGCKLRFKVKADMLNGFDSVHGGVLFAASDSAFAFACNAHGYLSVALDVSITFTQPAKEGDILFVEAKEQHLSNKIGLYEITTRNADGKLICLFKGTAYRTGQAIEPLQ